MRIDFWSKLASNSLLKPAPAELFLVFLPLRMSISRDLVKR